MACVLVLALAAASALALVSAPARAEGEAGTKLGPLLEGAFRQRPFWGTWQIDEVVIAEANAAATPEVCDQFVPVLVTAHARHAAGYDRLRAAVCMDDEAMSADRAHSCSTLPVGLEEGWRRRDRTEQWVVRGVATAAYAGAITAAYVERDQDASRRIATVAGVPMGAVAGITVLLPVAALVAGKNYSEQGFHTTGDKILIAGAFVGGLVAGGVVGARVANSLAASPGARAPVTAVALAPVYLTTLVMTIDFR